MMWKGYRQTKDAIEVPEFLIEKTLVRMNLLDKQVARRAALYYVVGGLLAFLALFILLNHPIEILEIEKQNLGLPPFEEPIREEAGSYCTVLNIEDMRNFASEADVAEIILSVEEGGQQLVIRPPDGSDVQLTVDDFEARTGVLLSQFSFSGFAFDRVTWRFDEDDRAHATYSFTRGDQRAEILMDASVSDFVHNSLLEDRPISLFFVDGIYIAFFTEGEVLYRLVITDVAEATFIRYLSQVIAFIED